MVNKLIFFSNINKSNYLYMFLLMAYAQFSCGLAKTAIRTKPQWPDRLCAPQRTMVELNLVNPRDWNIAHLIKLVWNLSGKPDSLWIRWINAYYMKNNDIKTMTVSSSSSWMFKAILKQREVIEQKHMWSTILNREKIKTKDIYLKLLQEQEKKSWRKVFLDNGARPRAKFCLWLACQEKLATKERLKGFGILNEDECCFCSAHETQNHLLFECGIMQNILMKMLD